MRIRRIVICGLSGSRIFSPHYLINGTIFETKKKVTEHKICVLIVSTILSEIFLIITRIQRDTIKNVYLFSRKVPDILVGFQ